MEAIGKKTQSSLIIISCLQLEKFCKMAIYAYSKIRIMHNLAYSRVIKGTKVLVVIKRNVIHGQRPDMEKRHTQQKHTVTKIIHTK